jgi:predicted nucleotidyltransferase
MERNRLLQAIRSRLEGVYGRRLRGVLLHGSEARGEATDESDIDLLILLDGPINLTEELHTIIKTLYPLQLETDRVIEAFPVAYDDYEAGNLYLYRNAKKEGVLL